MISCYTIYNKAYVQTIWQTPPDIYSMLTETMQQEFRWWSLQTVFPQRNPMIGKELQDCRFISFPAKRLLWNHKHTFQSGEHLLWRTPDNKWLISPKQMSLWRKDVLQGTTSVQVTVRHSVGLDPYIWKMVSTSYRFGTELYIFLGKTTADEHQEQKLSDITILCFKFLSTCTTVMTVIEPQWFNECEIMQILTNSFGEDIFRPCKILQLIPKHGSIIVICIGTIFIKKKKKKNRDGASK